MGDETHRHVLFNMIEAVVGTEVATLITLIYIINILTLNCLLIKWLNGDIIDHLFHFIHDNHDHKFDNANSTSLIALHNSETLNLTDKFDIFQFEFTDSKLNINEFFLNIFIFLLIFLFLMCNETTAVIYNKSVAEEMDNSSCKIEIRNINRISNKKKIKILTILEIVSKLILYLILFLVIFLSLSFDKIQLVVKCEKFFKNGFNMVSLDYTYNPKLTGGVCIQYGEKLI